MCINNPFWRRISYFLVQFLLGFSSWIIPLLYPTICRTLPWVQHLKINLPPIFSHKYLWFYPHHFWGGSDPFLTSFLPLRNFYWFFFHFSSPHDILPRNREIEAKTFNWRFPLEQVQTSLTLLGWGVVLGEGAGIYWNCLTHEIPQRRALNLLPGNFLS